MDEKYLEINHLTKTSNFRQSCIVGGMPPFFKWSLGYVRGFVGGEKMTQFWRETQWVQILFQILFFMQGYFHEISFILHTSELFIETWEKYHKVVSINKSWLEEGFMDCLWRENLMSIYCDLLRISVSACDFTVFEMSSPSFWVPKPL